MPISGNLYSGKEDHDWTPVLSKVAPFLQPIGQCRSCPALTLGLHTLFWHGVLSGLLQILAGGSWELSMLVLCM